MERTYVLRSTRCYELLKWKIALALIIALLTAYTGAFLNFRVFRYFHVLPVAVDYAIVAEETCVGLMVRALRLADIVVQPGRLVCTTREGEPVYESAVIQARIGRGSSLFTDIFKLYVNTTRPLNIRFVVEYPSRRLNATLSISRGRAELFHLPLSETTSRSMLVEPGTSVYNLNIRVAGAEQGSYSFRVGIHVELLEPSSFIVPTG